MIQTMCFVSICQQHPVLTVKVLRLQRLWSAVDLRESIDASTSYEAGSATVGGPWIS